VLHELKATILCCYTEELLVTVATVVKFTLRCESEVMGKEMDKTETEIEERKENTAVRG